MPRAALQHQETTLVFEPDLGTVELYTTSRALFLRAIKRNPNYIDATDLQPGYRLLYSTDQCRIPESILRLAPGGDDLLLTTWLTPIEIENRNAAAARLLAVRPDQQTA